MIEIRTKKRAIIIAIYFCVAAIFGWVVYYLFSTPATCMDRKMNQGEKGIDCGGPCSPCKQVEQALPLSIVEKAIAPGGRKTFDAVFRVQNPNPGLALSSFSYEIVLKDTSGKRIGSSSGSSYILPGEKKYVIAGGIKTDGTDQPVYMDVNLDELKWSSVGESLRGVQITTHGLRYEKMQGTNGTEVQDIIRNESDYTFDKVNIVVIVRNMEGKIIAANSTEKNTVRPREERDFRLTWPYDVGSDASHVEVEGYANIL